MSLLLLQLQGMDAADMYWFHWVDVSQLSGRIVSLDKHSRVIQSPGFVMQTRVVSCQQYVVAHPAVGARMRKAKGNERETMPTGNNYGRTMCVRIYR